MNNLPKDVTTQSGMDIAEAEDYLGVSRQSIRNKTYSGDLKRKRVGGNKFIYETQSVLDLKEYIDSELVESKDVMETLKDNGLADSFKYFGGKGKESKQCKYERLLEDFPISPKQLQQNGYIDIDTEIKPVRYKKQSIVIGIVKLKNKINSSVVNNTNYGKQTKNTA